jgi:hypothetical protein
MARVTVVTSTCDRCHHEVNVPVPDNFDGGRLMLPEGWLHVSGVTTVAVAFVVDLCAYCKGDVLKAAGAHR